MTDDQAREIIRNSDDENAPLGKVLCVCGELANVGFFTLRSAYLERCRGCASLYDHDGEAEIAPRYTLQGVAAEILAEQAAYADQT